MPKPRTNYEPQISQREGVWGMTLRITTGSDSWTGQWAAFGPEVDSQEKAAVAARLTVKRMIQKLEGKG